MHHMHTDDVQFSHVVCALHGAAHSTRSTLVVGNVRKGSPEKIYRIVFRGFVSGVSLVSCLTVDQSLAGGSV